MPDLVYYLGILNGEKWESMRDLYLEPLSETFSFGRMVMPKESIVRKVFAMSLLEVSMIRYDKDRNQIIDPDEVFDMTSVLLPTFLGQYLSTIGDQSDDKQKAFEEELRSSLVFFLKYGELPLVTTVDPIWSFRFKAWREEVEVNEVVLERMNLLKALMAFQSF